MTGLGPSGRYGSENAPIGMPTLRSFHGQRETIDRLVDTITARGMTIFARIDHRAGAVNAGLSLRPTELIIFGNARVGTPLMQAAQTSGIDLPLKALVWQDEAGTTWLGYNDPLWLASRHEVAPGNTPLLHAMGEVLTAIAREATGNVGDAP
jgi:uncharacterized protein (DUF302 family)